MPTLEFKGKQFIYSHHLSVPFRELKVVPEKSYPKIIAGSASLEPAYGDGNQKDCRPDEAPRIRQIRNKPSLDDNLEALKALLPTHADKIDYIFIDPPYNTGNEGWCYNDNVRSPLMKEC